MDNFEGVKVGYAKNLPKQNFNLTMSLPIDNNVNIKTILDVSAYVFDQQADCSNGKVVVNGKLGVKVLYIDVDNITNTVADSMSFSQTVLDTAVTQTCFCNCADFSVVSNVLSFEGNLKINCNLSFSPTIYLNLAMQTNSNFENMIVKKKEISTNLISGVVASGLEYTTNFETKDNISKILCYNCHFNPTNVQAFDGYAVVEGKLFSSLVYETSSGEETEIKQLTDTFNLKSEVKIDGLDKECGLDISFAIDQAKNNLSTEIEDNNSVITVTHAIKVAGVMLKPVSLDLVDDVYSVDNEIETAKTEREIFSNLVCQTIADNVFGEITLADSEPAIDNIICNLDIQPEITNSYVKDGNVWVEGVISSQIVYIDENKACCNKQTELPFVINTKIEAESIDCLHSQIYVCDCKIKAKRGTIIELDYSLNISINLYVKQTCQIIDNLKLGKPINFGMYDYQIFLAKPNETMWELCKRIKISPDDILKFNSNLPPVMEGGEKVIIKRWRRATQASLLLNVNIFLFILSFSFVTFLARKVTQKNN